MSAARHEATEMFRSIAAAAGPLEWMAAMRTLFGDRLGGTRLDGRALSGEENRSRLPEAAVEPLLQAWKLLKEAEEACR